MVDNIENNNVFNNLSVNEVAIAKLSFDRPIPKSVRSFGKVVDPAILQPGDLILVSHKKPKWAGRNIMLYQENMFSPEHARWQHVAISGGRFEICEATVFGVKACEYWEYMTGEYEIKIRRLKNADESSRNKVAYYAATSVKSVYGFGNILNLRSALSRGNFWKKPVVTFSGVICSQLYFEACMREGYLLANIPPENVCPAHLSISSLLVDVPVSWVNI